MVTIYRRQTICKANVERQKEPSVNTEKEQRVWRRSRKRRVKGQDDGETERQGGAHTTGRRLRLMTGPCQSDSHRESRALPSAPKLMGRRQGGEVRCDDMGEGGCRERRL